MLEEKIARITLEILLYLEMYYGTVNECQVSGTRNENRIDTGFEGNEWATFTWFISNLL